MEQLSAAQSSTAEPPVEGRVGSLITAVKGLTVSNVLVIALLAIVAAPLYLGWRAINDPALLDRFTSKYEDVPNETTCFLREIKLRGGPDTWNISNGFAYFGTDKWFVSVSLSHAPTPEEVASHCEVLNLTIDWMRSPEDHPLPKVPGSDSPLIWQYPLEDGGFHRGE